EPVLSSEGQTGARQRIRRGEDRGQRRAQVVGNRAQEGGLECVALPQGFRLEGFGLEPVPLDVDREERGERRQEAALHRHVDLGIGPAEQGGDAAEAGPHGQRLLPLAGPLLAQLETGSIDTEDAGTERSKTAELVVETSAAEQVERSLGERVRLDLP